VTVDRRSGGWRALTWADLTPKLLGDARCRRSPRRCWSPRASEERAGRDRPVLDGGPRGNTAGHGEVRERLLKAGLSEPDYTALRDTFDALSATADDPAMTAAPATDHPREVTIFYWGQKIDNNMPLTRQQDANEYTAGGDRPEGVGQVHVTGRGFHHFPNRTITLVPPPMLTRLERDEYVPAYTHHRGSKDGKPRS